LETHPKSKSIEMFCVIVFTLEYLIRLLTVTSQSSIERFVRPDGSEYREAVRPAVLLRRFLVDPMNLLDLSAVLPWYILLVIDLVMKPDGEGGLQKIFGVVRLVRLTRILRIFKVSKSMKMMIVLFRTLVRSRSTLLLLLAASLVLMLAFGAFAVVFERGLYNPALRQYVRIDGSPSPFLSIPEAMYWCMTTMTTVGYGDLYPITPMGWLFGVLCALTGIIILSLPITVIGATFQEEYEEQQRIAERQRRLVAHAAHMRAKAAEVEADAASIRNAEAVANATSSRTEAEASLPGRESVVRRFCHATRRMRVVSSFVSRSSKPPPMSTGFVPGSAECEWLLEDYRENCANEIRAMIGKGEDDLTRMARKVIIHSRILSSTAAREGEEGPDNGGTIR